jgi:hypothetical protein
VPHRADHHGKVIGHDVLVTHSRSASGLIKLDPWLRIDLAIAMVKLFKIKTSRPDDLSSGVGELLGARGIVNHIVLHATTGFMGRMVLSSLFNVRT